MFDSENKNPIQNENPVPTEPSEEYKPVSAFTYQNTENGYQGEYNKEEADAQPTETPFVDAEPAPLPVVVPSAPVPPTPTPREKKPRARFSWLTLACCMTATALLSTIISVVITAGMVGGSNAATSSTGTHTSNGVTGNSDVVITDDSNNFVEAVATKVSPSVVGIVARYTNNSNNFFGQSSDVTSEGSGVIYSSDGYIITNKHVIDYAISYGGSVEVYLPEAPNDAISAKVVGYDAAYDLAVLKIDRTGLSAITVGSSSDLTVGQHAVAIGNPGGLEFMGSVSVGYISGISRSITVDTFEMKVIQTDAAINPGNSGGALVDSEGKLIGITNSKIVSEDFEGMGFAIPVDSVVDVCNDLITNSSKPKAYIGVQIDTSYSVSFLEQRGYPAGIVVASVVDNSPAAKAGIQRYDIITKADGTDIDSYAKLVNIIQKHNVGDTMTITVYRSGKTMDLKVTTVASNG